MPTDIVVHTYTIPVVNLSRTVPMAKAHMLLLALLGLIVALASAATENETAVSIASLNGNSFAKLCDLFGPLAPIPDVRSNKLCETSGFSSNSERCIFLDLTESGLMYMSDETTGSVCHGPMQSPAATTSLQGKALPYPLSDQRPLETTLSSRLLASEGASIYWLWRNLLNFELWAGCAATNTPQTVTTGTPISANASYNWLVPTGWNVYSTLWQADGSNTPGSGLYWPFATVINKTDSVVVFIRGTETIKDWMTDFNYNQTSFRSPFYLPGKVHQGFGSVAASLWPHVQAALSSLVKDKSSGSTIKHVYVAGHSLGAGVSTLISYAVQDYLETIYSSVRVDALLFAPPNVGDSTFASYYGRKVNARRIPFQFDLIPQVPCTPTMIGCQGALVPTNNPRNQGHMWSYSSVPGTLQIKASGMPEQSAAWSLLGRIYFCQIGRFLRATHICSYNCYFSQYVTDNNNMCRLWNATDTAPVGSFCFDFPVTEGLQYPYVI